MGQAAESAGPQSLASCNLAPGLKDAFSAHFNPSQQAAIAAVFDKRDQISLVQVNVFSSGSRLLRALHFSNHMFVLQTYSNWGLKDVLYFLVSQWSYYGLGNTNRPSSPFCCRFVGQTCGLRPPAIMCTLPKTFSWPSGTSVKC